MAYNAKKAVAYALAQVGKAYGWAQDGPSSFDCSGLVMAALAAGGKHVDHNSSVQVRQLRAVSATPENKKKLRPGDVVFWYGNIHDPQSVTHCGIYVGRTGPYWMCVAAVDWQYGVKKHRMNWALKPSGFGFIGHK